MKALKKILLTVFFICLSLFSAKQASGHCHVGFAIGTGFCYPGPFCDGFYFPCWYGWPSYCYPDDCFTSVVITRPIVIQRKTVVVQKPAVQVQESVVPANADEETLALFASIRNKKENLLAQLEVTDKQEKIKAIAELAGYSYDETVIEKLKEILLKDPDSELRKEAAKAFGEGRNSAVVPILRQARLGDSEKAVRDAAENAIKAIKGTIA